MEMALDSGLDLVEIGRVLAVGRRHHGDERLAAERDEGLRVFEVLLHIAHFQGPPVDGGERERRVVVRGELGGIGQQMSQRTSFFSTRPRAPRADSPLRLSSVRHWHLAHPALVAAASKGLSLHRSR